MFLRKKEVLTARSTDFKPKKKNADWYKQTAKMGCKPIKLPRPCKKRNKVLSSDVATTEVHKFQPRRLQSTPSGRRPHGRTSLPTALCSVEEMNESRDSLEHRFSPIQRDSPLTMKFYPGPSDTNNADLHRTQSMSTDGCFSKGFVRMRRLSSSVSPRRRFSSPLPTDLPSRISQDSKSTTSCHRKFSLEMVADLATQSFDEYELTAGIKADMQSEKKQLTDEDKDIIAQTWAKISNIPGFAVDFGCAFFRSYIDQPATRQAYKFLSVSEEGKVLMETACSPSYMRHTLNTLSLIVCHLQDLHNVKTRLRHIGAQHYGYGVDRDDFVQCFSDAMMYTIQRLVGKDVTPWTMRAWYLCLQFVHSQFHLGIHRMMRQQSSTRSTLSRGRSEISTHSTDHSDARRLSTLS